MITEINVRDGLDDAVEYSKNVINNKIYHDFSYFACTCKSEVKKYWKDKIDEIFHGNDPEICAGITSQLVAILSWDYNCFVSDMYMDQWFGFVVECQLPDSTEIFRLHMQCDEIEIGLFAAWTILKKVFPNVD